MGIEAIDHLYVETPAFDETRAFWEGLGFTLVDEWGDASHRAARLTAGETFVVLVEAEQPLLTVHFRVSGVDQLAGRLATTPVVTVQTPLEATHWNSRRIRVQDPDGRVLAFEQAG